MAAEQGRDLENAAKNAELSQTISKRNAASDVRRTERKRGAWAKVLLRPRQFSWFS
jgi:hypothetical protein